MSFASNTTSDKAFRALMASIFAVVFLFSSFGATASDEVEHGEAKKFNAGEMITHHIQDAHCIHIGGHITIPLPCIVKTDKGFDFFMSSVFMDDHHGFTSEYYSEKTGNTYALHHEKIVIVDGKHAVDVSVHNDAHSMQADSTAHAVETQSAVALVKGEAEHQGASVLDLSITKSVFGMFLILGLVMFLFIRAAKAYQKRKGQAPKGLQNFLEPLVLFIKDEVAVPALGKKKAMKYLPLLLTCFFFIWACNLFGLLPFAGGFNITGTLSITMVLAAIIFIVTTISGNGHYWGHILWPPGVPFAVKLILVPIEIASVFIKPTVLMIRLTANINAGHIVILALTSLIFIFTESSGSGAGVGVGVATTLFMVFMFFIELLVAFLQAYVFTLLAALYFGDATQEHHHEEAH